MRSERELLAAAAGTGVSGAHTLLGGFARISIGFSIASAHRNKRFGAKVRPGATNPKSIADSACRSRREITPFPIAASNARETAADARGDSVLPDVEGMGT
jgi:hypothetical protein